MYDFMLSPEERDLKYEVRALVRDEISSNFLRKMDKDEITYPREFVEKLADRGLLGIRFPKRYGGRDMSWVAEVAACEEIGCLWGWPWAVLSLCHPLSGRHSTYSAPKSKKKRT